MPSQLMKIYRGYLVVLIVTSLSAGAYLLDSAVGSATTAGSAFVLAGAVLCSLALVCIYFALKPADGEQSLVNVILSLVRSRLPPKQ
jgi:hypothetical protein